jgi:hypothetical protein
MDKETYDALKRIIDTMEYIFEDGDHPDDPKVRNDIKSVRGWIDEVAKEYDE